MSEPIVAGIAAAKEALEAAWDVHCQSFTNNDPGHEALIAQLRPRAVELIVIEASGGHETACACALQAAGFGVAVVSPRQARDFAKSMEFPGKTDGIDARVLRRFAALIARQPDRDKYIKALPRDELQALQALVARRRQLVEMLTAECNRLATGHRAARPSIEALVRAIRSQLDPIDKQMARHATQHHADLAALLNSMKYRTHNYRNANSRPAGIGPTQPS